MPAPQLSAAWWKKHRALLCKDVGLEKALKDYEKAKGPFERDMSGDNYQKLTLALNAVTKAAKAQAKHCEDTNHQKTKGIAEGYEDVVQDALKDAQKARLDLVRNIETCTTQWRTLLEGALGLNERCSKTEQVARALANAVEEEVAKGNAEQHKKAMLECAKELGDHHKQVRMVSKETDRQMKEMKQLCGVGEAAKILKDNPNRLTFGIIENAVSRTIEQLSTGTKLLMELEKERVKQEKFLKNFAPIPDEVPAMTKALAEVTPRVLAFFKEHRDQLDAFRDDKVKLDPKVEDKATELYQEVREINHKSGFQLDILFKVGKRAPNSGVDTATLWKQAQKNMRGASVYQDQLRKYSKIKN